MRTSMLAIIVTAALACAAAPAAAQNRPSLGVSLGGAFPGSPTANIPSDRQASFNWGFYVNLPLLETFNIVPSAELYKFGQANATDFDLAFKFIVPLQRFALFAGISPGLTTVNSAPVIHIGALGGASFRLAGNLGAFVQAKYNFVIDGSQNTSVIHLNTGLLFNF